MITTAAPDALSGAGLKYSSVGLVMPFRTPDSAPDSCTSDTFEFGTAVGYNGMISCDLATKGAADSQPAKAARTTIFLPVYRKLKQFMLLEFITHPQSAPNVVFEKLRT
jgi:hypothetical protein